jgi:hypothetical protein
VRIPHAAGVLDMGRGKTGSHQSNIIRQDARHNSDQQDHEQPMNTHLFIMGQHSAANQTPNGKHPAVCTTIPTAVTCSEG